MAILGGYAKRGSGFATYIRYARARLALLTSSVHLVDTQRLPWLTLAKVKIPVAGTELMRYSRRILAAVPRCRAWKGTFTGEPKQRSTCTRAKCPAPIVRGLSALPLLSRKPNTNLYQRRHRYIGDCMHP